MSFNFEPLDFAAVKTRPLTSRTNKVSTKDFAKIPASGCSFSDFLQTIPSILAGADFKEVVDSFVNAHRLGRCVLFTMGAHVIKVGLSPIIIELMRRGIINAVAMNGAGSIHDTEIALIGATSEDVSEGIKEGNFGMVDETGALIAEAARLAWEQGRGFGQVLGEKLVDAPFAGLSIMAQAARLGIPVTIHIALGSDIVHMHPAARGDAYGAASFNDFRLICGIISTITEGSIIFNAGSAVILPTVIEKGLSITRNMGYPVRGFVGVTCDFNKHYRSEWNPVRRARELGGKGYYFIGHHEFLIPLLAAGVIEKLGACAGKDEVGDKK